jgi:hypothetical protein
MRASTPVKSGAGVSPAIDAECDGRPAHHREVDPLQPQRTRTNARWAHARCQGRSAASPWTTTTHITTARRADASSPFNARRNTAHEPTNMSKRANCAPNYKNPTRSRKIATRSRTFAHNKWASHTTNPTSCACAHNLRVQKEPSVEGSDPRPTVCHGLRREEVSRAVRARRRGHATPARTSDILASARPARPTPFLSHLASIRRKPLSNRDLAI